MYADADPAYDAVVELSWPDGAAFHRAWASREASEQYLPALLALAEPAASAALLTEPYRVIWP
jgi:deoxyinosine 3'endonuclease (endonuclease V)